MVNGEYNGKSVYIGIDVHLRQYTVCCRFEGQVVKRATMRGYPEELSAFIGNNFPGAVVTTAYEAGFSGFVLHRTLENAGVKSIVVHAASIEISRKKTKTDKRDAQKIAEQLEGGRLRGIHVPTEAEEYSRLLPRTRAQLVRARTRIKNQIRMRLHYFGLLDPMEKRSMSKVLLEEVRAKKLSDELRQALQLQESVWKVLDEQIQCCDDNLKSGDSEPLVQLYRSVPGFGRLIAVSLARELGDMHQFESEKKLFSFTGLTPSEFTSDDARHLGHITRQGSARLRHLLVQAAWVAIRKDRSLQTRYIRIAAKAGKKRAIVAIARKLIGKARAVVRKKEHYKLEEQKMAA
jgi:transposase